MFEVDFNDLEVGGRTKPPHWVAVAPKLARNRQEEKLQRFQKHEYNKNGNSPQNGKRKKTRNRRRQQKVQSGESEDNLLFHTEIHTADDQSQQECIDYSSSSNGKTHYSRISSYQTEENDPNVTYFPCEIEDGNVEYKFVLKDPSPIRFQQLVTQMRYRLSEGEGEAVYLVGVEDDGYPRGLQQEELDSTMSVLKKMCEKLRADIVSQQVFSGAYGRLCVRVQLKRSCPEEVSYTDIRIAALGAQSCGKSTLLSILTTGMEGKARLDNGQGSARMSVLRHKHEIETGHTSSVSQQVLGYDCKGKVLNYSGVNTLTPTEISAAATKIITFIDLGGSERYLKTALYGLTCMIPDYALLCVDAQQGVTFVTRQHLCAALALDIPVFVVITKTDLVSVERQAAVVQHIRQILQSANDVSPNCVHWCDQFSNGNSSWLQGTKLAPEVFTTSQVLKYTGLMACSFESTDVTIPIIKASSKTGVGLDLIHSFLFQLNPHALITRVDSGASCLYSEQHENYDDDTTFDDLDTVCQLFEGEDEGTAKDLQIHNQNSNTKILFLISHKFDIRKVGPVVSGTLVEGQINLWQIMQIGPDSDGKFMDVQVTSIHRCQVPVRRVRSGQVATIALSEKIGSFDSEYSERDYQWSNAFTLAPTNRSSSEGSLLYFSNQQYSNSSNLPMMDQISEPSLEFWLSRSVSPTKNCEESKQKTMDLKGGVLIDRETEITVGYEFVGLVVLVSGYWPPRGLVTGKWPPEGTGQGLDQQGSSDDCGLGSSPDMSGGEDYRTKSQRRAKSHMYAPMIHCGSIRQGAQVVAMRELSQHEVSHLIYDFEFTQCMHATGVLQMDRRWDGERTDKCVVLVRFRFQHGAEWIQERNRFLVRDRSGGFVAGVGVVVSVGTKDEYEI